MNVTPEKHNCVTPERKRSETLNLRVTPEEKREVERCAAALGMSQTELVLTGAKLIREMVEKHQEKQRGAGERVC